MTLFLALAYAVSGKLALMLAVPPGYATPVFPAAGIALAACVVWGGRALPAIGLGSLVINVLITLENGRSLGVAQLYASPIVCGSMLQAWIGAAAMRRHIKPGMDSGPDVLRFFLLAPTVCVISSSIAISGLMALGVMHKEDAWVNWLMWWIGDSIGVLLAAPLTFVLIGHPRSLWWRRRWMLGAPLLLASALLIGAFLRISQWEHQRQTEGFRLSSQQVGDMLQAQFDEHERFLAAMAAVLNDPLNRLSQAAFTKMARVYLESRPELRSMGWAPWVPAPQQAGFEAWARSNVHPGFRIWRIGGAPAPADGSYLITFLEPLQGNERAQGLDFSSEKQRADAVEKAIASNRPAATSPLILVQERGHTRGIILLQAVKTGHSGADARTVGVISLVLETVTYLNHVLIRPEYQGILSRVEDVTDPLHPVLVSDSLKRAQQADDYRKLLHFGGRQYALILGESADSKKRNRGWQSWAVLLSGLLLTALLGALMLAISGEQRRSQAKIFSLAHHDRLTGLANRFMLNLRLEQVLALCRRDQSSMAVLFIDLDHFKKIIDTHGHEVGDRVLVEVARRLSLMVRDADTLARQGGDEFTVVLGGHVTPESVSLVAKRMLEELAKPYQVGSLYLQISASIGVAMFPGDSNDATTLLLHADTAMYAAKGKGRGNFQFFSDAMNNATRERMLLESRLWQALEQHEFELYLQPQINVATGQLIGAEALLRWHHPELGMVPPDRFIPIAEESGLMLPLGEWVLQRGCALLAKWKSEGRADVRLALNLSARQCGDDKLLPCLDRLLEATGIDSRMLELEMTESAAMHDPEQTRGLLRELRLRGIKVAIDDFGTGYSSLSYLKLFAIDRIKIDRSFVKDIELDPNDAVIVTTTIALAHAMGLEVIAEGVETQAQFAFLHTHGCDEAQGYLFGKPMTLVEFEQFMHTHSPGT